MGPNRERLRDKIRAKVAKLNEPIATAAEEMDIPDPFNVPPVLRYGSGRPPRMWSPRREARYKGKVRYAGMRKLSKMVRRLSMMRRPTSNQQEM